MKTVLLLGLTVLFFVSAIAQPAPDTLWTRTYGGSETDKANAVQQTADGGYIVTGYSEISPNAYQAVLIRTSDAGDTLWTRALSGIGNAIAKSLALSVDGGYVVAGITWPLSESSSDIFLAKTDSNGDIQWIQTYGSLQNDLANSVQQTADGGYIVAGFIGSENWVETFHVLKTDSVGNLEWARIYGDNLGWLGEAYTVRQTFDNGYIVAGYIIPNSETFPDFLLVKLDSEGDTMWTSAFGGSYSDYAYDVQQTSDGGYLVAGITDSLSHGAIYNIRLFKTDDHGDTLWTRTIGSSNQEFAYAMQPSLGGGYILAGDTWSQSIPDSRYLYAVRINELGETLWTQSYMHRGVAQAVTLSSDGGYVFAGTKFTNEARYDFLLIKTGPEPQGVNFTNPSAPDRFTFHPCYPNPFNAATQITYELPRAENVSLTVYNLLGEQVISLTDAVQTAGTHTLTFNGATLSSGLYFARLKTGEFSQTRKLVLLK